MARPDKFLLPPPTCRVTIVPMKTKRRAWVVAGVVVVLAGVVLAVAAVSTSLWHRFAYEEVRTGDMYYLKPRWVALSGQDLVVPPQICSECSRASRYYYAAGHEDCITNLHIGFGGGPGSWTLSTREPDKGEMMYLFTCTCPDASHKDKP